MTAERIAAHADDVLEALKQLATLLGKRGPVAQQVIELARIALATITGEDTPHDPAAIAAIGDSLRAEVAKVRARDNAALDDKFDKGGEDGA